MNPTLAIAIGVTCPIIVLKAKDAIVESDTPLLLVLVSNTSAGMIQLNGPQVAEKLKLNTQVLRMNAHWAPLPPLLEPGGNLARRIVPQMKVTMFPKLPNMSGQRRPSRSIKRMQRNWAINAMIEFMAWNRSVSAPVIPILAKMIVLLKIRRCNQEWST